jgi:hypothetical protein
MTLEEFIRENQAEIDAAIRNVVPGADLDDDERRTWIANDEGLNNWALEAGVDAEDI